MIVIVHNSLEMTRVLWFYVLILVVVVVATNVSCAATTPPENEFVRSVLMNLMSSDPDMNQPAQWRPRVYWLLFAECIASDAIRDFMHTQSDVPIRVYLESPPRGVYLLRYIERASQHLSSVNLHNNQRGRNKNVYTREDTDPSAHHRSRKQQHATGVGGELSASESQAFTHFVQALFYQGVKQMPVVFEQDRQLGALWFAQEVYYTDIPDNLIRRCTTYSRHHSVRFARTLANRSDMHFQWFHPHGSDKTDVEVPPEKHCECTHIGGGQQAYDAETCPAQHCVSQLQCKHGKKRVCVLSGAGLFDLVCTCSGQHGYAADLTPNSMQHQG